MPHSSPAQLDEVFSALAHAKRRAVVQSLALQPATVGQLAEQCKLSLPAIHKHIRILEHAELIQRKKVGRTNFVALGRVGLLCTQDWLQEFHIYWGSDNETLENYINSLQ
jgi:DNA-binding transcriptional ArsR family regulator